MCRGRRQFVFLVMGVFVLLAGLYVWHLRSTLRRLTPPTDVTDLPTFLARMPAPDRTYELTIGDGRFIELVGSMRYARTFASGPPAYVFDGSGKLVDWTYDDGDDPSYVRQWRSSGRRTLTNDELAARLCR